MGPRETPVQPVRPMPWNLWGEDLREPKMLLQRGKSANCEASLISSSRNWKFRSEPCCCRDLGFLNLQSLQLFKSRTSRILCRTQCASAQVLWELAEKLLRCAFASRTAFGSIGSSWALWSQCQLASLSTIFNKRSELFVSILWLAGDG